MTIVTMTFVNMGVLRSPGSIVPKDLPHCGAKTMPIQLNAQSLSYMIFIVEFSEYK